MHTRYLQTSLDGSRRQKDPTGPDAGMLLGKGFKESKSQLRTEKEILVTDHSSGEELAFYVAERPKRRNESNHNKKRPKSTKIKTNEYETYTFCIPDSEQVKSIELDQKNAKEILEDASEVEVARPMWKKSNESKLHQNATTKVKRGNEMKAVRNYIDKNSENNAINESRIPQENIATESDVDTWSGNEELNVTKPLLKERLKCPRKPRSGNKEMMPSNTRRKMSENTMMEKNTGQEWNKNFEQNRRPAKKRINTNKISC